MKTTKWYQGLNQFPLLLIGAIIVVFDVVVVAAGMWPLTIGVTVLPLVLSVDHVIWNVSKKESKFAYTGFMAGVRTLFNRE